MIKVIGLGPGELKDLPLGVYKVLKEAPLIYLRTEDHPVVSELSDLGIDFKSFDDIYQKYDGFDEVYQEIVRSLVSMRDVVYAVPGHPLLAEKTVQMLLNQKAVPVEIIGGQSFLDVTFSALGIDPIEGFLMIDSHLLKSEYINRDLHILIPQIYSQWIASEVKLELMEVMDDEEEVYLLIALGTSKAQIQKKKLYEIDRDFVVDNLTTLYIPKKNG